MKTNSWIDRFIDRLIAECNRWFILVMRWIFSSRGRNDTDQGIGERSTDG